MSSCQSGDRIPTPANPEYAKTILQQSSGQTANLNFTANRDTLWSDAIVKVFDNDGNALCASLTMEYCNTFYARDVDVRVFGECCDSRPYMLMRVADNKTLRSTVTLIGDPPPGGWTAALTLSGIQAEGCCD